MMARDRGSGSRLTSALIWLCVIGCAARVLAGDVEVDSTTTTTTTTIGTDFTDSTESEESTSLATPTEGTSNAIPEAEQGNSELPLLKKHSPAGKKQLDKEASSPRPDQLDKPPYPYLKKTSSADNKENAIRQAKRSDSTIALSGSLDLSVLPKITSTEATTASTIQQEVSSVSTTPSDDDEEQTTTQNTQASTESTTATDKSTVEETETTESLVALSTTPITLPTSTATTEASSTATTSTTAGLTTADTDVPTTESVPMPTLLTTVPEEASTTPAEQEQSTIATADMTSFSSESTAPAASTKMATTLLSIATPLTTTVASTTTIAAPTTTTTTATTTTTTTATTTTTSTTPKPTTTTTKPLTTVSPKKIATTTSEPFSGVITTWQDETLETTTELVSPTPPSEDVTLLVRILLEGSWKDVCTKLPILRQSLTDLLNSHSEDKPVSPRQILFHQTQCSKNLSPSSLVTDKQLTPVLVYVVDENGNFDVKLTKILPSLYEASPIDFPLTIHSVTLVPENDSGNAIAVVIVSCVAFICLILLAGLLFIMRKRQGRFNYGERCRPVSLDAYSLDSVSAYNSVRRNKAVVRSSKRSYGNPAFEDSSVTPTHPLNFAGLSSFCSDTNAVAEEFVGIPQIHSKIEELPPGAEIKNRYANGIPLPETRVPLQRINNDPLTEYINASYVRGPKNATKYYIACQAPTEATVADFWRMIWEQQCKVIIMLTDLVENGVDKCTEYIPPLEVSDCHRLYGDYQVTLKKREAKEKYAISTLHLKNLENNTFREVSHIWYLWPASGVPTDAAGLIAVLLEARAIQRGAAGPIVVHCSPGTGRTGTLIALDLCIRQYEITRTVDVPRVVYTIRRDRAGAVQTREQYVFIYKGLNLYASKLAGGAIDST